MIVILRVGYGLVIGNCVLSYHDLRFVLRIVVRTLLLNPIVKLYGEGDDHNAGELHHHKVECSLHLVD